MLSSMRGVERAANAARKQPALTVKNGEVSVGVSATAGPAGAMVVGGRLLAAVNGKRGTKAQQAAAKRALGATVRAAQKGSADAVRALAGMMLAKKVAAVAGKLKKPIQIPGQPGWFVTETGDVKRVR